MMLGIVGLGYVGLPLALAFAEAGNEVVGLDLDAAKLADLAAGRSYIEDVDDAELAAQAERLSVTADYADLADCEAVIVCVPTPLSSSREPDLSYLRDASAQVAAHLQPGQLIVLESTSYPGTTREELLPALSEGGRTVGEDFYLAFSPERIDPGRSDHTIRTTPKLVGGITPACTEHARDLYAQICDTVEVLSSPETAELAKLLENIFRSVNIALVNEVAQLCDRLDIDVWEVVDAAATKPFGFMPFYPGPGLGGHCIPIDPFYLTWKAREFDHTTRFIELAGEINRAMPARVVEKLAAAIDATHGKGLRNSRILLIGIAYKKNVDDTRESPAFKLLELLEARGANTFFHDPFVAAIPKLREHPEFAGRKSVGLDAIGSYDAVLVVTDHDKVDWARVAQASLVVDTRNALARRSLAPKNLVKA
jgi:UDP-N-acetyl-D-glucosamine dehydrogenase